MATIKTCTLPLPHCVVPRHSVFRLNISALCVMFGQQSLLWTLIRSYQGQYNSLADVNMSFNHVKASWIHSSWVIITICNSLMFQDIGYRAEWLISIKRDIMPTLYWKERVCHGQLLKTENLYCCTENKDGVVVLVSLKSVAKSFNRMIKIIRVVDVWLRTLTAGRHAELLPKNKEITATIASRY